MGSKIGQIMRDIVPAITIKKVITLNVNTEAAFDAANIMIYPVFLVILYLL